MTQSTRSLSSFLLQGPDVEYGQHIQAKKGEDDTLISLDCMSHLESDHDTWKFHVFAVFDGHCGTAAALYCKENLLSLIMDSVRPCRTRDEWLALLPQAIVSGFIKADMHMESKDQHSGTTATVVFVDGLTITVACVGDSRCILDSQGIVTTLTVDHRVEDNEEERTRVKACGGTVSKNIGGGPLRCWPGGLCVSRSIGDQDAGNFIIPIPHVKQIEIPSSQSRLIIASDGVWDALSSEEAVQCSRGLTAELAASQIVKAAITRSGSLRDDTTCLVIDVIPPCLSASEGQSSTYFSSCLWNNKERSSDDAQVAGSKHIVEIYEEGSGLLADRLFYIARKERAEYNKCAVCQTTLSDKPDVDDSPDVIYLLSPERSEGPFLCRRCKEKKDSMEGIYNRQLEVLPNSTNSISILLSAEEISFGHSEGLGRQLGVPGFDL